LKRKTDFYIAFYEQLALHGFQAFVDHSKEHLALICVKGYNIAHLTKADTVEPNPYAEGVESGTVEVIRKIFQSTAQTFYEDLTRLLMSPDNGLDSQAVQEAEGLVAQFEKIMPKLAAANIAIEYDNGLDEGVEP
jgi:hypothetical protein